MHLTRAALALFAAFALLSAAVHVGALRGVDLALTLAIQRAAGPAFDVAAGVLTYAAAAEVVSVAMGLWALWRWWRGAPLLRAGAPLLFLASLPIELAMKVFLDQPPPGDYYRGQGVEYVLNNLSLAHSFPSGHATRTAFVIVLLVGRLGRGALPLTVVGLLAGASRVYLGFHWSSDVVGGFLLGGGLGCLALALMNAKTPGAFEGSGGVPGEREELLAGR